MESKIQCPHDDSIYCVAQHVDFVEVLGSKTFKFMARLGDLMCQTLLTACPTPTLRPPLTSGVLSTGFALICFENVKISQHIRSCTEDTSVEGQLRTTALPCYTDKTTCIRLSDTTLCMYPGPKANVMCTVLY